MIHFFLRRGHFYTVRLYLERRAPDLAPYIRLLSYRDLLAARALAEGAFVFTDLDRLSSAERRFAGRVRERILQAGAGFRALNQPEKTLLRAELLDVLHRNGVNRFRAFAPAHVPPDCRFPVFVREAREHHGSLTPLLHSVGAVDRAVLRLRLQGFRRSELLVVEHLDTRSHDGLYRKYSAFRVGDAVLARSLNVAPDWVVKQGGSGVDPALIEEERRYVFENPHEKALRAVFDLANVEYGRVDYGVLDGEPQIWEINLNPTIGPSPRRGPRPPEHERARPLREPARAHFHERFRKALRALDPGSPRKTTRRGTVTLPAAPLLRLAGRLGAEREAAVFAARSVVDRVWRTVRGRP